jgi:hypothetical protein
LSAPVVVVEPRWACHAACAAFGVSTIIWLKSVECPSRQALAATDGWLI